MSVIHAESTYEIIYDDKNVETARSFICLIWINAYVLDELP